MPIGERDPRLVFNDAIGWYLPPESCGHQILGQQFLQTDDINRLTQERDAARDALSLAREGLQSAADEVAAVRAERDGARAVLRSIEWCSLDWFGDDTNSDYCPVCHNYCDDGHKADCALGAALAEPSP